MNIENELFQKTKIHFEKLKNYGFIKTQNTYQYSKVFMDSFRAEITIDENGTLSGKIFDLSTEEEYTNFRIESQNGDFVNQVRKEYKAILTDIAIHCFDPLHFKTEQANRIATLITNRYHDKPVFAWDNFPEYGIFKNSNNDKWYGLIMNINQSKLETGCSSEVEIINVKVDPDKVSILLKKKGFYPAYHMNKKNWITIILNDTLSDEEILEYIKESHQYTEISDEWIIPANPKFYDVINCFNETNITTWKQSNQIHVGDIIYLYVAAPYSAILYKCQAIEVNIPYEYQDSNIKMSHVMKIKLLERFQAEQYPFSKLKEYGIQAIRGPRRMPQPLSKDMNQNK